jgi:hypothetical protein
MTGLGVGLIGVGLFLLLPFKFIRSAIYSYESVSSTQKAKHNMDGKLVIYNKRLYTIIKRTRLGFTLKAEDGEIVKGVTMLMISFPSTKKQEPVRPRPQFPVHSKPISNKEIEDALSALKTLGYKVSDSKPLVNSLYRNGMKAEDLIREVLRVINQNRR